jgi:hypothetical protein
MVERRMLTAHIVDAATPPRRGERWVAGTKLGGFGLRLWATKSGGTKAFAIRVCNRRGKSVRKTFDHHNTWAHRSALRRGVSPDRLGEYLEEARDWARDEIDRLKGRLTLADENNLRWRASIAATRRIKLGRAAQSLISGMRARGLSRAYVDRIDKLFARYIPKRVQETRLPRVSPARIADVLVDVNIRSGNIRILRAFIGQIFERASLFDRRLGLFTDELSTHFWARWNDRYDVPFPELRNLTGADYERVFEKLEGENPKWQQALCIRLFFEFGAPLSRLMAAEWKQILDGVWYPYWPRERVYWFESRERINENASRILDRVSSCVRRDFGMNTYWFPSKFSGTAEYIRTVGAVWRNTQSAGFTILSAKGVRT